MKKPALIIFAVLMSNAFAVDFNEVYSTNSKINSLCFQLSGLGSHAEVKKARYKYNFTRNALIAKASVGDAELADLVKTCNAKYKYAREHESDGAAQAAFIKAFMKVTAHLISETRKNKECAELYQKWHEATSELETAKLKAYKESDLKDSAELAKLYRKLQKMRRL